MVMESEEVQVVLGIVSLNSEMIEGQDFGD